MDMYEKKLINNLKAIDDYSCGEISSEEEMEK